MTIIIVDGWAHRMRKDGLMESAKVDHWQENVLDDVVDEYDIDNTSWAIHQPVEMGLTGGEYATIKGIVQHTADLFPEGRPALPTSEGLRRTAANPEGM